ncbi:MAG: hypothetical protein BAJALOKI3v1_410013 [Promethearchaeota archaeon]|jgi:hypothetical protein|nr:MAG: hypothetical protein BAJALOKI3v1_410013 [Candidatus Lokiarchaeota archaeon]
MIVNDLNKEVEGKYNTQVIIDDNGEDIIYVFPKTENFITIREKKPMEYSSTVEQVKSL